MRAPIGRIEMPALPQIRILVVDDEPLVCDAIKMMLEFDGHAVETARNPQDALSTLEKTRFDVVITDFEMPFMKGDELAAAIKARDPKQPIILITAYTEMLQASGNPLKGIDCMISKPFLLENLRQAIARVMPASAERRTVAD